MKTMDTPINGKEFEWLVPILTAGRVWEPAQYQFNLGDYNATKT